MLFTSDHGYHMGEHGHYQKMTLFEAADRVPLIISYPGMSTRGRRSQSLVEMVDFYRTLGELAGLPEPPAVVQGRSLVPVLRDPAAACSEQCADVPPFDGRRVHPAHSRTPLHLMATGRAGHDRVV
ncbi:MAG: sulfatase-like hydrolase/transferase [Bdellovibrionaceae bacterium]|nr:sulfatase-like hydrolase/transferase [Pseudobdellovibrionaceae bacterium]